MSNHEGDFKPLDPGRIEAMDPHELRYWCAELDCTEAELKDAIAAVGEHVAAVRARLASSARRKSPGAPRETR